MIQEFYISSLRIILELDNQLTLRQFDNRFIEPILPVKHDVFVHVNYVDTINIPKFNHSIYQSHESIIWKNGNVEFRYYLDKDNNPEMMSCMDDKMNITISILKSRKDEIMKQFRPWFNIHLERLLLYNDALLLHSASIIYKNQAILFTAPSGTGKTTQANLWHEQIDNVSDLNGDRTVLQKTDEGWCACGFPIYGGSIACKQEAVPIKAIVNIRQSKKDHVIELSSIEKIQLLYSECTIMGFYEEDVEEAMNLLESLINEVKIIKLECTKESSAVEVLYQYLYGE